MIRYETWLKSFYARIEKKGDCMEWTGFRDKDGYGGCRKFGEWKAHRVSFVLHKGPIPQGALICHHCDNPPCVNPKHLFLGTRKDNTQDMMRKKRNRSRFLNVTHCVNGHEFTKENTHKFITTNKRQCRTCVKIRMRKFRANKEINKNA